MAGPHIQVTIIFIQTSPFGPPGWPRWSSQLAISFPFLTTPTTPTTRWKCCAYTQVTWSDQWLKVFLWQSISISNLKNTHWSLGLDGKCCHLSSPSTPETAPGFQLLLIMLIYPSSNDVNINEICCVSRFNLPGNSSTSSSRKTPLTTSSSGGRPCYKVKLCSWFSCSVILNPILFQFNLPLCCSHHIGKYFRIQYIWNIE